MSDPHDERSDSAKERKDQSPVDDLDKRAAKLANTDPVEKDMTEEEKERFRGGR